MQAGKRLFAGMRVPDRRLDLSRADIAATIASAALLIAFLFNPHFHDHTTAPAVLVAVGFATLAFLLRGVTVSGAVTGAFIAFLFWDTGGLPLFALLMSVFVVTLFASRLHSARSGRPAHPRSARQVWANLAVPSLLLLSSDWDHWPGLLAVSLIVTSLAELAADTVSSEIGEGFAQRTFQLPGFDQVPAGTNGGISVIGTCSGVLAALLTVFIASLLFPRVRQLFPWWPAAIGAVSGMVVDSVLGSTLENRGWLNNDGVNALGTLSAVVVSYALYWRF